MVDFDFRCPDYDAVFARRLENLEKLRATPSSFASLTDWYAAHPADFINDFGVTLDPRNAEKGLPTLVPFVLWPKQREFVEWAVNRWRNGESGIIEKCRDSGASWLALALSCTLCLFTPGLVVGVGSRKLELVDQIGSPRSLFERARIFLEHLPPEFLGGWTREKHAPLGRIIFPGTGSIIHGEGGDNLGRGDRAAIYWVDEAAFLEHPELADAALSATTNCRLDISTPNGRANSFATRRFSGNLPVFSFRASDDPRKTDAYLSKKKRELDPVSYAQEYLVDYAASVEGVLIPAEWSAAAVGAAQKLGIEPTGTRRAGFDVADEGIDRSCVAARHGISLYGLESWRGRGSDIYASTVRAFDCAERFKVDALYYDSDGLGAGVRGDARTLNERREADSRPALLVEPFRGSAAVDDPDGEMIPDRTNKDYFANLKAQCWWHLRRRFEMTFRALQGHPIQDPDALISIDPNLPELAELLAQLSQPTWSLNSSGKVLIDKKPAGTSSPDRADAVMIAFAPLNSSIELWARLGSAA